MGHLRLASVPTDRFVSDAGDGDGILVNIEADEDGGIVTHADLRMREPI